MKGTIEQGEFIINIETGALTRVTINDTAYGVSANGYAKHYPDDTYDEKFGLELASSRAWLRVTNKRIRKLLRATA